MNAEDICTVRALRPFLNGGQPVHVGDLIDLPRWVGADLIRIGRAAAENPNQFKSVAPSPSFAVPTAGIFRR
jgi:hypothetical protein